MRQKQAPFRVEDDIERGDITMATAATEDFHRESGDGLCGDFSCPHCAFSVDQDVMLKVLKHFFNCTSLQYIIDLSVGNAANLGGPKPSPAPRRASKAPQPHSEPSHRHVEPPAKRRATEARATPPQETPRIVTTQAPTLLARLNAAQSRTQSVQSVGQREIPSEPEHRTVTTRHVDTVQPRAIETTTTTTAEIELPSIPTIKEEPGDTGASCVVEPTPPTLFDEPMHTQKETDSGMGVKRDSDNVGGILDTLPGTSSSGLFSEDLNFGGAGPSFPQTEPPQDDSSSGNGHRDPRRSDLMDRAGQGLSPWQHDIRELEPTASLSFVSVNPNRSFQENPAEHTCRQCGRCFDSSQSLSNHIQIIHQLPLEMVKHNEEEPTTEMSDVSPAVTTAPSNQWVEFHGTTSYINSEQMPVYVHLCSHCEEEFESRSDLSRHMRTQHQKMKCTICGLELSNRFNHDRHVKMKHSSQRDFACVLCEKTFKRKDHLQRHIQSAHPSW